MATKRVEFKGEEEFPERDSARGRNEFHQLSNEGGGEGRVVWSRRSNFSVQRESIEVILTEEKARQTLRQEPQANITKYKYFPFLERVRWILHRQGGNEGEKKKEKKRPQ